MNNQLDPNRSVYNGAALQAFLCVLQMFCRNLKLQYLTQNRIDWGKEYILFRNEELAGADFGRGGSQSVSEHLVVRVYFVMLFADRRC